MANSILKYDLDFPGKTTVSLPCNSAGTVSILSAKVQGPGIVVYVVTDDFLTGGNFANVVFFCAETGIDTLPDPDAGHSWARIDTCMLGDCSYVIHVFVQNCIQ